MNAIIELRNLEIYAFHGCYAEEQRVGNRFIFDADIEVDASRAAQSDDVSDALNYLAVVDVARSQMAVPRHLLESVVSSIVAELHRRFDSNGLLGGWVRVRKMAPPVGSPMESVAVRMSI